MVGQLFTAFLLASCAYACLAGGKEGRWISLFVLSAALLSIPASYLDYGWFRVQLPVLVIDVLLLGGLLFVAVRSRRFWPLWMTAFHLISISTHVARIAEPHLPPLIYFALQSFWSLPGLLAMVAGIMLDRRAGLLKSESWKGFKYERSDNRKE